MPAIEVTAKSALDVCLSSSVGHDYRLWPRRPWRCKPVSLPFMCAGKHQQTRGDTKMRGFHERECNQTKREGGTEGEGERERGSEPKSTREREREGGESEKKGAIIEGRWA